MFASLRAAMTMQVPLTGRRAHGIGQDLNASTIQNDPRMSAEPIHAATRRHWETESVAETPEVARKINPPAAIPRASAEAEEANIRAGFQ